MCGAVLPFRHTSSWRGNRAIFLKRIRLCILFGKCQVRILAGPRAILTEDVRVFDRPSRNLFGKQKVKVNLTLEQATKAQRGSRGIAVLFP